MEQFSNHSIAQCLQALTHLLYLGHQGKLFFLSKLHVRREKVYREWGKAPRNNILAYSGLCMFTSEILLYVVPIVSNVVRSILFDVKAELVDDRKALS